MSVTMKDIAALIGISRQAVAAALEGNGHTRVSPETRKRVLEVARKLNYIPNAAARTLRGGTTRTIGIISSPGTPYSDAVFAEICQVLRSRGYRYLATDLIPEITELSQECMSLASRGVDGIIVAGSPGTPSKVLMPDIPLVFCRTIDGESDIDVSREETGYLGTAHLLEHGHKSVAYLGIRQSGTKLRKNGWKRALQDYGAEGISIDLQSLEGSAERLMEILRTKKITALFCSNDFLAAKVMRCLSMAGWEIPRDIAITGCDGNSFIEYTTPTLTTVIQPIHQIAEQCAELILERIRKKINGVILSKIHIKPKLWIGGSCGCPEQPIHSLYRINSTGSLEKDYCLNFNHSFWKDDF